MDLPGFLQALGGDGQLIFASPHAPSREASEEADAVKCLEEMDARRRLEMPWTPPALNREQAIWATRKVYRAGQFLVFRELPAETVRAELQDDCPGNDDATRQYSVDLTFGWLPQLHRRAASISSNDELTNALGQLGACYPLSFIGLKPSERFEALWKNPSLRALFVDRIIAGKRRDCLSDQRVLSAVQDAIGPTDKSATWLPI